jgi:hypothetical protein
VSKKYRGKLCAYCATANSTTVDHVFAREFFQLDDRHNLPKAPACKDCNDRKARLEHYLVSVLPFGARHELAVANLLAGVPKRLAKNLKLQRELSSTRQPTWLREGSGLYQRTSMLSFDGAKLEELLKYIALGLAWYHWGTYLAPDHFASVMFMPDLLSIHFQEQMHSWSVAQRAVVDLGQGTVQYEGVQLADPPESTVWGISMYGGVMLPIGEISTGADVQTSSRWWVINGPPQLAEMIDG